MTTQDELIGAFLRGEESPTRASNMRLVSVGSQSFLIGGEGGREFVLAKREPMSSVRVYGNYWPAARASRLRSPAMARQARRTRNKVLRSDHEESGTIEDLDIDDVMEPQPPSMFDRLTEETDIQWVR